MAESCSTAEFYSWLGGQEKIPPTINLKEFASCRMDEVLMLTDAVNESPFKGQIFQRLPKHMRRRQMSHHIKRLPRRLQNAQIQSLKDGAPLLPKRPSRRYRRRPGNLLLEYNRRQKNSKWLETHVWHAKRFHMTERWGYSLPQQPVNKGFRANYRATSEHCLLTDISYYNCIELRGNEAVLLQGLQQCVSPKCGLTFAAKSYLKGMYEGSVTLHHPNSYPHQAIGEASFLWKPVTNSAAERILWIWIHPLMHQEVAKCFMELFHLSEASAGKEHILLSSRNEELIQSKEKKVKKKRSSKKLQTEVIKLNGRNIPFVQMPKYTNSQESVKMILLKDTLNRFRLTGPLSQAIISTAFNVKNVVPETSTVIDEISIIDVRETENIVRRRNIGEKHSGPYDLNVTPPKKIKLNIDDDFQAKETPVWWRNFYEDEFQKKCWKEQKLFYQYLQKVANPAEIPPRLVFSIVVGDPRVTIPKERSQSCTLRSECGKLISCESIDPALCQSPLWCSEIREEVSTTKVSQAEINEVRSKLIVPGTDLEDSVDAKPQSMVPLLLIQRPGGTCSGTGRLGYGSGWDVIIPAGWGMPVWLALVLRGARVGGLRESSSLFLESGSLRQSLQPDSTAGEAENELRSAELKKSYFKLPPNKRSNFQKLGIVSPFYCPWRVLVQEWVRKTEEKEIQKRISEGIKPTGESQSGERFPNGSPMTISPSGNREFYVLRDIKKLRALQEMMESIRQSVSGNENLKVKDPIVQMDMKCLVPVCVECCDKGTPRDFAILCLPTLQDIKEYQSSKLAPTEQPHSDQNQEERKRLKAEHSKLLKCLKRKRRNEKQKSGTDCTEKAGRDKVPAKEVSDQYNMQMERLWLPETTESVINSASRSVLGFLVKADFCFSKAQGRGMGYVTLPGLLSLLETYCETAVEPLLLLRNTGHVQYRFGKLKIAFDSFC